MCIPRKINFLQLGRYGRLALAIDPRFLSKAGKKTDHIGRFWSGCASAVKRGRPKERVRH